MHDIAFLKLAIPDSLLGYLEVFLIRNEPLNSNSQPVTLLTEVYRLKVIDLSNNITILFLINIRASGGMFKFK
jgi:Protein chain release factor B